MRPPRSVVCRPVQPRHLDRSHRRAASPKPAQDAFWAIGGPFVNVEMTLREELPQFPEPVRKVVRVNHLTINRDAIAVQAARIIEPRGTGPGAHDNDGIAETLCRSLIEEIHGLVDDLSHEDSENHAGRESDRQVIPY